MENLLTFSTSQLLLFLAALPVFITALIFVKKYLISKFRTSFDFNASHYLIGLAVSLSTSIALINWETYDGPIAYEVEEMEPDPSIVHIPRTFQKQIPKAVPPPPKPKKILKPIDLTKLKLVTNNLVPSKSEPLVDQADIPESPVVAVAASPPPAPKPIVEVEEEGFVFVAEQMPRFPGCVNLDSDKDREACSKQKLLDYVYSKLKYPPYARENGIEGTVVLQFVVSMQGRVEDLKIARDIGGGCGAAAAKVVSAMNDMAEPWTAGKQRGRPVKVLFTLPVKFKLN